MGSEMCIRDSYITCVYSRCCEINLEKVKQELVPMTFSLTKIVKRIFVICPESIYTISNGMYIIIYSQEFYTINVMLSYYRVYLHCEGEAHILSI